MKIDVETGEKSYERVMNVEVPWEDIKDEYQKSFKEFQKDIKMPGFRPGKVPAAVIKKQYGQQIDYQFAADAIDKYYGQAIRDIEDEPVNQGAIEDLSFSEGEPLKFSAKFDVEPEVDVYDYQSGYDIEHTVFEATPEDVDSALDDLRERHATTEEVEEVEKDHLIVADLQQVDAGGTPIIGQKVEDRQFKVGEGVFGGNNYDQLKGAKVGDTVRISIEPDQPDAETEFYDITVKKIEKQNLPELDDEFAKEVSEEAETYDELREEIQERIQSQLNQESNSQLQHRVAHTLVDNSEVELPESMIDNYLNMLMEDVKRQRQQQGQSPEIDETVFKQNYRDDAKFSLKWQLIKKQIIEQEELEAADEDVDAKVEEVVESYPEENREAVKNLYKNEQYRSRLVENILDEKVTEHIKSFANIKETKKTTAEVRQEAEAQRAAESAVEEMK